MPNKRFLDEDENAYRVLAMLFEPIVSESFAKMKEERAGDESGKGSENALFAKRDKELAQFAPTPLSEQARAVGNPRDADSTEIRIRLSK